MDLNIRPSYRVGGNAFVRSGGLAVVELDRAIAGLRQIWSEARLRCSDDSGVPRRAEFTPEILKAWLPNIVIVEAVSTGAGLRFRVRLAGTAAVAFGGRNLTGMFLDEAVAPGHYEATIAPYRLAIADRQPVEDDVTRDQFMGNGGTRLPVRRLVMPCSSDGVAIDRFVVGLFLYRPEST